MSVQPKSLFSGLIGAVVVTALNEGVRRIYRAAPRLEKLGMDAAAKSLKAAGAAVPDREPLYWGTMIADVISNALYYSVISLAGKHKKQRWMLGTGLGLAAGLGAVVLPKPLELDASTTNRTNRTKALTVAWYLTGALVATAAISMFARNEEA